MTPAIAREASAYFADLWRFRYFWSAMVKVDLGTRYRRSFLGLGWSLIKPISMTAVICIVFGSIFGQDVMQYAPFVLVGMTFWGFITETIFGGCVAFQQAEGYLRQIKLPAAMFTLRVVLAAGFHFLVLLPVALAAVILTHGMPGPLAFVGIAVSLVLLFVLGWSLATLAALVTVHFPDMRYILEIALQIVFYLTPIIYPAEILRQQRVGEMLLAINPFGYLLELVRKPLIEGTLAEPSALIVSFLFTLVCAVGALVAMTRLERRLIFWL